MAMNTAALISFAAIAAVAMVLYAVLFYQDLWGRPSPVAAWLAPVFAFPAVTLLLFRFSVADVLVDPVQTAGVIESYVPFARAVAFGWSQQLAVVGLALALLCALVAIGLSAVGPPGDKSGFDWMPPVVGTMGSVALIIYGFTGHHWVEQWDDAGVVVSVALAVLVLVYGVIAGGLLRRDNQSAALRALAPAVMAAAIGGVLYHCRVYAGELSGFGEKSQSEAFAVVFSEISSADGFVTGAVVLCVGLLVVTALVAERRTEWRFELTQVLGAGLAVLVMTGTAAALWLHYDFQQAWSDRALGSDVAARAPGLAVPTSTGGETMDLNYPTFGDESNDEEGPEVAAVVEVTTGGIHRVFPVEHRHVKSRVLLALEEEPPFELKGEGSGEVIELENGEVPDEQLLSRQVDLVGSSAETAPYVSVLKELNETSNFCDDLDGAIPLLRFERTTPISVAEPVVATLEKMCESVWIDRPLGSVFAVQTVIPESTGLASTEQTGYQPLILNHEWMEELYYADDFRPDGPCGVLRLNLHITAEGHQVGVKGSSLKPTGDCPEQGPTICLAENRDVRALIDEARDAALQKQPDVAGDKLDQAVRAYDWSELYEMLTEFKRDYPHVRKLWITGEPEIPMELWTRTADAVRYQFTGVPAEEVSGEVEKMLVDPGAEVDLDEFEREPLFDRPILQAPEHVSGGY